MLAIPASTMILMKSAYELFNAQNDFLVIIGIVLLCLIPVAWYELCKSIFNQRKKELSD